MRAFAVLAVLWALATIGWGCYLLIDLLAQRTYHSTASYPVVATLDLETSSDVTLVPDATDRIVVDRTVHRGLHESDYSATETDGVLTVHGGCRPAFSGLCSTSLTIHVPTDIDVRGYLGDGSLTADDVRGSFDVGTGDGGVHLTGVTGAVRVHTGDGDVDLVAIRAPSVQVATGDGSTSLQLDDTPSSIQLSSGDGDVDVCLPATTPPYAVTDHHGDGGFDDHLPTDPRAARTLVVSTGDGSATLRLC